MLNGIFSYLVSSGRAHRFFPLVLFQQLLTDADRPGRHLHQFVVIDKFKGEFERRFDLGC